MKLQSGSNRKKFWLSTLTLLTVLLVCSTAVAPAESIPDPKPDVVKLLPNSGDVKGWEVYPNTIAYGSGDDIFRIYNGGYELYTDNGVIDAVQQIYRSENDIAIATFHRLTSIKAAKEFFARWHESDKKLPTFKTLKVPSESYVYTAAGTANGYLVRDKFFVTVSVHIDGDKGINVTEEYFKTISNKIRELVEPDKQPDDKHTDKCQIGSENG